MKNSLYVSSSQHYFYSAYLCNDHKIVYYEEDEATKGGRQLFFSFLEEVTSQYQAFT